MTAARWQCPGCGCENGSVCGSCPCHAGERTLAAITADAMLASCGWCWGGWGQPCDADGVHLARFARARRRGLISETDMAAVLGAVAPDPEDVFTPGTVILAGAA